MSDYDQPLSPWEEAIEYGSHVFGVLPDKTVTGLLSYDGRFWKSYIHSWEKYFQWEQQYDETPLADALEAFVEDREMWIAQCSYNGEEYAMAPMEGGALSSWRFEHRRKLGFKRAVLRGDYSLPAPAIFNRHGDCFIEAGNNQRVVDLYWEYVDENWEHRHDHHTAVKS